MSIIKIIDYSPKYKIYLIQLLNDFMDYLVSIDTFGRMTRQKGYGQKYFKAMMVNIKKNKGILLLAEQEKKIVGFAVGTIGLPSYTEQLGHNKKNKIGRLDELFIEKNFRGKGVGLQLINAVEDYFRKKKCNIVRVEVFSPNQSARKFYEKFGYQEESVELVKSL
jgi:ribosomal protein S18 acetylase RimI-like enzyme